MTPHQTHRPAERDTSAIDAQCRQDQRDVLVALWVAMAALAALFVAIASGWLVPA